MNHLAEQDGAGAVPSEALPRRPNVSVIMPVWNAAGTLRRAVESALAQTLRNVEVIACDDASSDDSVVLLEAMASSDPRVIVLREAVNRGPGAARNRALDVASGDWVAILDADDWFAADRLATLLELGGQTGADFLADNQYLFDAGASAVVGTGLPSRPGHARLLLDDLLRNSITGKSPYDYGLLQPVIRRSFLVERGIRYREECRFGEDFLLALDCLAAGANAVLCFRPMYYVTQPHGLRSGTQSRPDRIGYDYRAMRRFNDAATQSYEGRLSRRQLRLLHRRSRSMRNYADYVALTSPGPHRPWRLACALWRPRLWPYLFRAVRRHARLLLPGRPGDHREGHP